MRNGPLARRATLSVAVVATMMMTLFSSGAQAVVPGIVDLAVDIKSKPPVVAPAGELVLLESTVSNVGVVESDGTLTVELAAGTSYRDDLSNPACSASGNTITCPVPSLSTQESVKIDVVAHTPVTVGPIVTTAHFEATVFEPVEYQANNTDSATTDVRPANPNVAAGLVEEGDSLELDVGDGRHYVLTVPEGVPGVIVRHLAAESGGARICGLGGCGDGFKLDFVQHPYFKAVDPSNPLVTVRTFGSQEPCRGLEDCADIYWAKDESTTILSKMENCPGSSSATAGTGEAIPSPCINQRFKKSGLIHYDVRLLSNDPLELPPLVFGK